MKAAIIPVRIPIFPRPNCSQLVLDFTWYHSKGII